MTPRHKHAVIESTQSLSLRVVLRSGQQEQTVEFADLKDWNREELSGQLLDVVEKLSGVSYKAMVYDNQKLNSEVRRLRSALNTVALTIANVDTPPPSYD
jgi:hypothetical protein